ncbi:MAG: pantetheine-phosphate adenylyltransferase [Kiritimatiellia bacterium]|jgi:pantetheine-phosphate adenylyltransferase
MRKAVYAGSFDPPTNGHVWMINEGLKLFDDLTVAIGINPGKTYTFTIEERISLLKASLPTNEHLDVADFENRFLVDYAQDVGAQYILRGIRSENDYEYERVMRNINEDINGNITTVFLMPPRNIAELSSSMVEGLVGPVGWESHVEEYVPGPVFKALQAKHRPRS